LSSANAQCSTVPPQAATLWNGGTTLDELDPRAVKAIFVIFTSRPASAPAAG
jgi:hypothetical protein